MTTQHARPYHSLLAMRPMLGHGAIRAMLRRGLREPLLHFLLIGGVIFAVYDHGEPAVPSAQTIEVTPAIVERLTLQYSQLWNRPVSAEERAFLIEEYVREEVLYREAMSLGLDQDDSVIRQRLRQKMEFIGESAAASMTPSDAELRAWFETNMDRFAPTPSLSFRQITIDDPANAPAVLSALAQGAAPETLGRVGLLPASMDGASAAAIDGTFGPGFSASLAELTPGEWQGPVASAFGMHLVVLDAVGDVDPPPFEAVRDQVLEAWEAEAAERMREMQYQELRSRYQILMPPVGGSQ